MTTVKKRTLVWKLRRACKNARKQRRWALANGISPQHVNDVLKGRRKPSDALVAALGYKRAPVTYKPIPGRWTEEELAALAKWREQLKSPYLGGRFEDI